MFINLSNHPSSKWTAEQYNAASQYGEVVDMPFANIEATLDEAGVARMAAECADEVERRHPAAVMCQGEYTYTYAVVSELRRRGIKCLAACTQRVTTEHVNEDGTITKESVFKFERFREYKEL